MTKRAYYTDLLYAAIAKRDHDMKFCDNAGEPVYVDHRDGSVNIVYDDFRKKVDRKAFVQEMFLPLLTPRVGDYGGNGKYSGVVYLVTSDQVYIILPWKSEWDDSPTVQYGIPIESFIIEKRDGKFFPWPEWE